MSVTHHQSYMALGGDATIVLVCPDEYQPEALFARLWQAVFAFEKRFSRFLWGSEITAINHRAGLPTTLSPEAAALLRVGVELSRETDGLITPFILPALQRRGYLRSTIPAYRADPVPDYRKRTVPSYDSLQLTGDVLIIPHNSAIDIGGHGKGYLADSIARMLRDTPVTGYWVSLSGDVAVGGRDEHDRLWPVYIQQAQGVPAYAIHARQQRYGVATSGTYHRSGQATMLDGHHIIDPDTKLPAHTDIRLATVVAENACRADALATCAVLLGSEQAGKFLQTHGAIDWLLQTDDGAIAGTRRCIKEMKKRSSHEISHAVVR